MRKLLKAIDNTSIMCGKVSSLLTLVSALVVAYEVIMRLLQDESLAAPNG